jgi:flagella basal body P-ring formation protein FlgA
MTRLLLSLILAVAALSAPARAERIETLVEEMARDKFGPELPDNARFAITLQNPNHGEAVMLSAFWMDRATSQFLANAVLAGGEVVRIGGLAVPTVAVPVPLRRVLPGEILAAADLRIVELPLARLGAFALTDAEALVGMQVRRLLAPGRPVMVQSVMQPLIIDRGDRISIRYDDGQLSLSAPGRALDDAHRGEEIRVVNLVSNTMLVGIATAEGVVEVLR